MVFFHLIVFGELSGNSYVVILAPLWSWYVEYFMDSHVWFDKALSHWLSCVFSASNEVEAVFNFYIK